MSDGKRREFWIYTDQHHYMQLDLSQPDRKLYPKAFPVREWFATDIDPDAATALAEEVERLKEENAVCRDAIEDAMLHVEEWEDANGDDVSQGAARATRRQLNEAIGKACPRLLMEKPEGQKLYGLHWKDQQAELARLRQRVGELEGNVEGLLANNRGAMAALDLAMKDHYSYSHIHVERAMKLLIVELKKAGQPDKARELLQREGT